MGLQYGIKQARESLLKLLSEGTWERKVSYMYSEIGVVTVEDTSIEIFQQINEWQNKFLKVTDSKLGLSNVEKEDQCRKLAEELIFICTDMIEENSKKGTN